MIALLLAVALAPVMPMDDGLPSLPDTNYECPSDAFYVATDGDDLHSGSRDAPLRSVSTAVNRAPDGATIVIHNGVYRETIGTINKRLILQPYPHDNVWIKGSIEVTGWMHEPHCWRKDDWHVSFDQNSYGRGEIDTKYPLAGKPDMVFINDHPLDQVGSLGELGPGSFYVDYEKHALYIGDDPHGKLIEAAIFGHAFELCRGATGSVIRGIGCAHFANVKHEGAVRTFDGVSAILFENVTFAHNAGSSLLLYDCREITLRHNVFVHAGYQGLSAWKTIGLNFEDNQFVANNCCQFATDGDAAGAAGAKIFASTDVTARKNNFTANHCTGLWFDGSCHACNVVHNRFDKNERAGVHVEESARVMVAGNQAEGNGEAGVYISNSSDVRVYNNLLVDNNPNVVVQDDSRINSEPEEKETGVSYITAEIKLFNNVFAITHGVGPMLWVRDFNSVPRKSAGEMIDDCDFNSWQHPGNRDTTLVEWWDESASHSYSDLNSFRLATGCESHGIESLLHIEKVPLKTPSSHELPPDVATELELQSPAAESSGKLNSIHHANK